jgi:mannose-6-phosphate isomerase
MNAALSLAVRKLEPVFVERVWGRENLAPLFGQQDTKIGEVWFPAGPHFPLLVKFIFTSERLSIQVHPADEFAAQHENGSLGKTEMWHILSAEPDATIALGLRHDVTREALASSIADGTVLDLMEWVPVKAGDTLYAPAGVIHAIGAGITLCEIQQNSDVTYRLYDYGRPRALHLDKGLAVSQRAPFDGRRSLPLDCNHFTIDLLNPALPDASNLVCEYLLIPTAGSGTIAGQPFQAGQCWLVQPGAGPVEITGTPETRILRARPSCNP